MKKKKLVLGGVLYNTAKSFGANDTIASSLGMLGGGAEMFLNPVSGGIDAAQYGAHLIQNREFGGLTEFNGNKHMEGGIEINPSVEVEGGETMNQQFVFSDKVKPKGSKLTYAELSKRISSKYNKRGDDKMAKESMQIELDNLKRQHESDPQILKGRQQQSNQMAYGGPTNPLQYNPDEYDSNIPLGPEGLIPSGPDLNQFEQSPIVNSNVNFPNGIPYADVPNVVRSQVRASQNLPNGYMNNGDGSVSPIPNQLYLNGVPPIYPEGITPRSGSLPTKQGEIIKSNQGNQGNVASNQGVNKIYNTLSQGQTSIPITGALLNSVGPAAQLAGTLINGVDDVNFERMKAKHVDYDPSINITERNMGNAMATNRQNVANYANSGGQALSNLVAGNVGINANGNEQIAKIKQDEINANAQIDNSTNQINTGISNEEQIARQQNKAAYRQAIYGALTDMGNIGAGYTRDNAMLKAQDVQNKRALEMLNSLPYRYGWNMG